MPVQPYTDTSIRDRARATAKKNRFPTMVNYPLVATYLRKNVSIAADEDSFRYLTAGKTSRSLSEDFVHHQCCSDGSVKRGDLAEHGYMRQKVASLSNQLG
jgi:hypothetical protein